MDIIKLKDAIIKSILSFYQDLYEEYKNMILYRNNCFMVFEIQFVKNENDISLIYMKPKVKFDFQKNKQLENSVFNLIGVYERVHE